MAMQSNGQQQQPQRQVIEVHVKQDHGLIWFLFFGWWYVGWVVVKWCFHVVTWPVRFGAKVGWLTLVKWPWQASVKLWQWSVAGGKLLTERYGWRGWAVAGGVVIVLAILGSVMGH